jgi:ubiquinone/menaquinone biosynthesis C-methylase UbiE
MSLGRRKVRIEERDAWVFNRMVDVYDARPPYPAALIETLASLVRSGGRVVDVGAGIGHVAIPLAARGLDVIAIEPAELMLERLRKQAEAAQVSLRIQHAAAEALPVADRSTSLVTVVDALHFLDAERSGMEVARVLEPGGALAVVRCELGQTPFMNALVELMAEAAPRRPRNVEGNARQLTAVAKLRVEAQRTFSDETEVDGARLERILKSISFIGPAMNEARFRAFRTRVMELPAPFAWARTFVLDVYRA